ncbi:MAG: hypothetical protein KKB50_01120 [Planctomycetes bacterium]|nr:hypothetical protein [Planctomycetota bacterium]
MTWHVLRTILAHLNIMLVAGALAQRARRLVIRSVESVGRALLVRYQAGAMLSQVCLRQRDGLPRVLGITVTLAIAAFIAVALLMISWSSCASDGPSGLVASDGATASSVAVCCRQCGHRRLPDRSELRDLCIPARLFYCPNCQAYTACREDVSNGFPATASPPEVSP